MHNVLRYDVLGLLTSFQWNYDYVPFFSIFCKSSMTIFPDPTYEVLRYETDSEALLYEILL